MEEKTKKTIKELLEMYLYDTTDTIYFLHYKDTKDYDLFKTNPLEWKVPIIMLEGMTLYAIKLEDIIIDNIKTKKYQTIISLCLDNLLFHKIFKVKNNNYSKYIIAKG